VNKLTISTVLIKKKGKFSGKFSSLIGGGVGLRKNPFASAGDGTPVVQSVVRYYTD
jgi:hypothetical protein